MLMMIFAAANVLQFYKEAKFFVLKWPVAFSGLSLRPEEEASCAKEFG